MAAMAQAALFDYSQNKIGCRQCGEALRDLSDLRRRCEGAEEGGIHRVTTGDYFALYRRTYGGMVSQAGR
jgi:hypothetical protein